MRTSASGLAGLSRARKPGTAKPAKLTSSAGLAQARSDDAALPRRAGVEMKKGRGDTSGLFLVSRRHRKLSTVPFPANAGAQDHKRHRPRPWTSATAGNKKMRAIVANQPPRHPDESQDPGLRVAAFLALDPDFRQDDGTS